MAKLRQRYSYSCMRMQLEDPSYYSYSKLSCSKSYKWRRHTFSQNRGF